MVFGKLAPGSFHSDPNSEDLFQVVLTQVIRVIITPIRSSSPEGVPGIVVGMFRDWTLTQAFSAGMGFHHYTYHGYDGSTQVIPAFGGFIGGSYFITPNFGFNAEAGFDITNFQVGVVFKIQ